MKGLKFLIVSLLISIVNSERSNHIQRYPSKVSDSSESSEDNNQCKDGSGSSSTGNPKILFDIFLPESIRYMEVNKVDVMIYNKLSSKKSVDVEVTIPNDADNSNFRFFNNKFDPKNEPELTKITTVPFGRPQYVSFYIQTTDEIELKDVMNFKVKSSVKSENFECYLTQPVNVKPPVIKIYHNNENTFNLIPTRRPILMPITPYYPKHSTETKDLRMSVEVSGHSNKLNKVDFSVTLSNKNDFSHAVFVITEDDPVEVILPENTKTMEASIKGTGFCTITVITEISILVKYFDPQFKLKITRLSSSSNNEAIVRVCAAYNPIDNGSPTMHNVVYDVEMPSGYIYKEVINKSEIPEIKFVEPRWAKSRVLIFFNKYQKYVDYCVDVRAKQIRGIPNAADAVVMIYDYDYKENLAVGYFNFYG